MEKKTLLRDKHVEYIKSLEEEKHDSFEYWATEHLKVSGIYWGYVGIDVLHHLHALDREKTIQTILAAQHPSGGFGGNKNHDPHLLYTLSAVQVLVQLNALDRIDTARVAAFVASMQNTDGSFRGDQWGEIDTRFSYIAVSCLSLLHRLDLIDIPACINFVLKCKNFDEAFGVVPGGESHAGQTFCCVGMLAILDALDLIDAELLGWWLAERQVKEGGLNGRPEKLPDVCYSWWVLSCLAMLGKLEWIDKALLTEWILSCQDEETGGFADKPGNMVDVYHTCFGLTGLSLLGYEGLQSVDPRYCMTKQAIDNAKLPPPPQFDRSKLIVQKW